MIRPFDKNLSLRQKNPKKPAASIEIGVEVKNLCRSDSLFRGDGFWGWKGVALVWKWRVEVPGVSKYIFHSCHFCFFVAAMPFEQNENFFWSCWIYEIFEFLSQIWFINTRCILCFRLRSRGIVWLVVAIVIFIVRIIIVTAIRIFTISIITFRVYVIFLDLTPTLAGGLPEHYKA